MDSRQQDQEEVDLKLMNELHKLIYNLTNSGQPNLDIDKIKRVKRICQRGSQYVQHCYDVVIVELGKEHSEIRLSALQIIDEIFLRSHVFRELLLQDLQQFCELTIETDFDNPLPPPDGAAASVKKQAILAIHTWHGKFGGSYKKLKIGYDWLKDCKRVNFQSLVVESQAESQRQAERLERQRRIDEVQKQRCDAVVDDMDENQMELKNILTQMESCFELLVPNFCTTDSQAPPREDEAEVARSKQRQHGMQSRQGEISLTLKPGVYFVQENPDNIDIIRTMQETNKLIMSKWIPTLKIWIKTLSRTGSESFAQSSLKRAIDLKVLLETATKKYKNLIVKERENSAATLESEEDSDENEDFEDVVKDDYEADIPYSVMAEFRAGKTDLKTPKSPTKEEWSIHNAGDTKDPTSIAGNSSQVVGEAVNQEEKFAESTDEAVGLPSTSSFTSGPSCSRRKNSCDEVVASTKAVPVVAFDVDLYHWEEDKLEPTIVRYDLEKFWRTCEDSEVLPSGMVASMRQRTIAFTGKFEPVQWTCRAPLPSGGKLCTRMDRFKCPFHGVIIPRDNMGQPSRSQDATRLENEQEQKEKEKAPPWQDDALLQDIEAATGQDLTLKRKGLKKSNLTDINSKDKTPRDRLHSKVLNKKSLKRVAADQLAVEQKRFRDKFANQFNYHFPS